MLDGLAKYLSPHGMQILAAFDEVAHRHQVNLAKVALAWVLAQHGINAPISATTVEQIEKFATAVQLKLSHDDLELLAQASNIN